MFTSVLLLSGPCRESELPYIGLSGVYGGRQGQKQYYLKNIVQNIICTQRTVRCLYTGPSVVNTGRVRQNDNSSRKIIFYTRRTVRRVYRTRNSVWREFLCFEMLLTTDCPAYIRRTVRRGAQKSPMAISAPSLFKGTPHSFFYTLWHFH